MIDKLKKDLHDSGKIHFIKAEMGILKGILVTFILIICNPLMAQDETSGVTDSYRPAL